MTIKKATRRCAPASGFSYARVTTMVDVATALFKNVFPGWSYRIAECSVSDDAWVIPDSDHDKRLQRLFPLECQHDPLEWFGTDVDLRLSRRLAAALCISMLVAHRKTKHWLAGAKTCHEHLLSGMTSSDRLGESTVMLDGSGTKTVERSS